MNKIIIVGFNFCKSFYNSVILCKQKSGGTEYRITVMDGEMEKQLCANNTLKEINGCLQMELSGNAVQDQIKTEIAKELAKIIKLPVRRV